MPRRQFDANCSTCRQLSRLPPRVFRFSGEELPMGLLELVTTSRRARQVRKLAAVVADRSLPAVLERLAPHIDDMSSPEARGYIRARAAAVVHREASLVLSM